MRFVVVSLFAVSLFVVVGSSRAARLDDAHPDAGLMRPPVLSAQEAMVWWCRGEVTLKEFTAATGGLRPRPDGPGYRWQFPDGAIVTDGQRLPNGEFVIRCWGPAPAE